MPVPAPFRRFAAPALALAALLAMALPSSAQAGRPPLSPRDTAELTLPGGGKVSVDYSRPGMRGRRIFGGLVPYGRVWRTGANAATTLSTDVDLQIGGARVPRGTYTLYSLPTAEGWTLIVNRQTGQWGTEYKAERDLVRIPMRRTTLRQPVETFTISLSPNPAAAGGGGTLTMAWENTRATLPIRVVRPPRS